jgi:uncharacterized protein YhbP (UPF0306 family)
MFAMVPRKPGEHSRGRSWYEAVSVQDLTRWSAGDLEREARRLLDASTLCAIATVSRRNRAHVNTAYFAWSDEFDLFWLSDQGAEHSRNVRANRTAAVAVYDSSQTWGKPDRGIQLFGSARELDGKAFREAETIYARRFPAYESEQLGAWRAYRFRPTRMKLFDERVFGPAVFVTAKVRRGGRVEPVAIDRPGD